jgi:hypothetical protein
MECNSLQTLLVLLGSMIRYQCAFCDETEKKNPIAQIYQYHNLTESLYHWIALNRGVII